MFDPPGQTDAASIDVAATMTNVRATCGETAADVISTVTFDVLATRRDAGPARQVVLPYFAVALQAGNQVVAKRVGAVALNFAAGSHRAQTRGSGTVRISRSAAVLPENVRAILTRRRKVGDEDAAIDPLDRSGGPRRGRPGELPASGRLPAQPGAASLQRDALSESLTRRPGRDQGSARLPEAESFRKRPRGRVLPLAFGHGRRRRSNRPRNLSGNRDRARLTVWKAFAAAKAAGGPPKG